MSDANFAIVHRAVRVAMVEVRAELRLRVLFRAPKSPIVHAASSANQGVALADPAKA